MWTKLGAWFGSALIACVCVAVLVGAGYMVGKSESEKRHAQLATALNAEIYEKGQALQSETNKRAELERNLKEERRRRSDAKKTTDHQSGKIKQLEAMLADAVQRQQAAPGSDGDLENIDPANYRIFLPDVIARVYNDARDDCHGLPDSGDPPIIPAPISEFTGDSVADVVRYLVADRCAIATDYNNLYRDAERLLMENKPLNNPRQ